MHSPDRNIVIDDGRMTRYGKVPPSEIAFDKIDTDRKIYQVSEEELDEIYEDMASTMSDEELGKVAGGTSCGVVSSIILTITGVLSVATITDTIIEDKF